MINNYSNLQKFKCRGKEKRMREFLLVSLLVSLFATNSFFFSGCQKDKDNGTAINVPDSADFVLPDPEGTITITPNNGDGGTTITLITPEGLKDFEINSSDTMSGPDWKFVTIGKMNGLGHITQIPTTGWKSKVWVAPGYGYVGAYVSTNSYNTLIEVTYIRLYIARWVTDTVGSVVGAEVKYQFPFLITPDTTEIILSDTIINMPVKGQYNYGTAISKLITIAPFNTTWSVTSPTPTGTEIWCTIYPDESINSFRVHCSANYNESSSDIPTPPRIAILTVKVEGLPDRTIMVIQEGWAGSN